MRTIDIVRLVRSQVAPDGRKLAHRSINMYGHANGGAMLTVRGKRCEEQYEPEREGLPAHAATLNDCAGNALLGRAWTCYSVRSTRIGSVEAARWAGRKQASRAAPSSTHPTAENAERSSALTPYSVL